MIEHVVENNEMFVIELNIVDPDPAKALLCKFYQLHQVIGFFLIWLCQDFSMNQVLWQQTPQTSLIVESETLSTVSGEKSLVLPSPVPYLFPWCGLSPFVR